MQPPDPNNPDHQAAALISYTLTKSGWIIEKITIDNAGISLIAHRPTSVGEFLTRPRYDEIDQ